MLIHSAKVLDEGQERGPTSWGAEGVICGPEDRQGNSQAKGSWLDGSLEKLQAIADTEGIMISGKRMTRSTSMFSAALGVWLAPIRIKKQIRKKHLKNRIITSLPCSVR